MLPAVVLAHLLMTARLVESGFNFRRPGKLQLHLGNTLSQPRIGDTCLVDEAHPYTVVLGNPPFSGVSDNHDPWVRQLLRGRAPGTPPGVANYFQVDGQPLGEKKHWLEDDYVKFVRLAHWLIEAAGTGVVGFVTNHGFLDNVTFRGMRQQLLSTFSRIRVVDSARQFANRRTVAARRPRRIRVRDRTRSGDHTALSAGAVCRRPPESNMWISGGGAARSSTRSSTAHRCRSRRSSPGTPNYFLVPHDRSGECGVRARVSAAGHHAGQQHGAGHRPRQFRRGVLGGRTRREDRGAGRLRTCRTTKIRRRYFTSGRSTKYPRGRHARLAARRGTATHRRASRIGGGGFATACTARSTVARSSGLPG